MRLNSKHRQDVSELQVERDSLRERVQEKSDAIRVLESNLETSQLYAGFLETRLSELEVTERAKDAAIVQLESAVAGERERARAANNELEQLRTDNEALSARSAHLEQQREQLAQRCASLQAEKEQLDRKCKKLEEEVDRLHLVDAMNERLRANNEQLRTNIELLQKESDIKCATTKWESEEAIEATKRESEASVQAIRDETQARIDHFQSETQMLRVRADLQHQIVEQAALAWQVKWMREKQANDKSPNTSDQGKGKSS